MHALTWERAAAWRASRHHLDRRAPAGSLLAVASRLCGLHAQVLSCAALTAWARIEDWERGAVERALWEERRLVKTWAMRGTLHLLPADELPLWHGALSTSPRYLRSRAWQNYFGMTLAELDRFTQAVGTALDGQMMTREELAREIVRITGKRKYGTTLAESSWGTILKPAAFAGHLCFAPGDGQRVRFTRPDTWLGVARPPLAPEQAVREVTRRFLAAYGPATARDLARWWTGGGVTSARQWLAALKDEICQVEIEGVPAWILAPDARELRDFTPARSVRLLPGFDQYVVGASHHAERLLPGDCRGRVYRPQGWISPVLLVNGKMAGVWRHTIKGSRVEVAIERFGALPLWARRGAAIEAERLGAFLGCKASLVWA